MWNWILLAIVVAGVVALLVVAARRQRRNPGDRTIGQAYGANTKKGDGGGVNMSGAGGGG